MGATAATLKNTQRDGPSRQEGGGGKSAETEEASLENQLVAMGFDRDAACVALASDNDASLESAVQWLCDHPDCHTPTTEQPSSEEERELESLLRRADVTNADANMRREEAMEYCRLRSVATSSLEKVYLYLKDKVHNNSPLVESEIRYTIFSSYGVDEASAPQIVQRVLELILVEEDELMLKQLINRLFNNNLQPTDEPQQREDGDKNDARERVASNQYASRRSKTTTTTNGASSPSARNSTTFSRAAAEASEAELLNLLATEREKTRAALEGRLARRKERRRQMLEARGASAQEIELAMIECEDDDHDDSKIVQNHEYCRATTAEAARAEMMLRTKLEAERNSARDALKERLSRRGRYDGMSSADNDEVATESPVHEAALDDLDDHYDALLQVGLAATTKRRNDRTTLDSVQRLRETSDAVEKELRERLEQGRDAARRALMRRVRGRNHPDEERRVEAIFDAFSSQAPLGASALSTICTSLTADASETQADENIRQGASRLMRQLDDERASLDQRLARERARQSAELHRRVEERRKRCSSNDAASSSSVADTAIDFAEWAKLDERCNAQELAALSEAQARFCGTALGWVTAADEPGVDASVAAALVKRHELARSALSEKLAADAATRRAALLSRLRNKKLDAQGENSISAAMTQLDRELHEKRWYELSELVSDQRANVLETFHASSFVHGEKKATDLREADRESSMLAAGIRAGQWKRARDQDSDEAALIYQQAVVNQIEVEDVLAAERDRQREALRLRLRARLQSTTRTETNDSAVVDHELEDWVALDQTMDAKEITELSRAHSHFCGQAAGIAGETGGDDDEMRIAVSDLVRGHDAALERLAAQITEEHARRRSALMQQVQKRQRASREIADEVGVALSQLDEELREDRKKRLRSHVKEHQAAVVRALESRRRSEQEDQQTLRDTYIALCENETAADDERRKREQSRIERQRRAIERRLARRKLSSVETLEKTAAVQGKKAIHTSTITTLATSASDTCVSQLPQYKTDRGDDDEDVSLVTRIEQARTRQLVARQLHAGRQERLAQTQR